MFSFIRILFEIFTGITFFSNAKSISGDEEMVTNEEGNDNVESDDRDLTSIENEKSFYGKVTSYFNRRGLINDNIYFTKKVVLGSEEPKVGDDVIVEASRTHYEGGWIVSKVKLIYPWSTCEAEEKPYKDFVVGSVFKVLDRKTVTIKSENEISIDMKYFKVGYYPLRGDWVNIEVWRKTEKSTLDENISEGDVISVSPLREKKIHGSVTELLGGHGFINENIFFPFSACERGHKLKLGDEVIAFLMESQQQRGEWRALRVERKRIKRETSKSMENKLVKTASMEACDISITDEIDFGDVSVNQAHKLEVSIRNICRQYRTFEEIKIKKVVPGFEVLLGPKLETKLMSNNSSNDRKSRLMQTLTDVFNEGKLLCPSMVIGPGLTKIVPFQFTPLNLGRILFSVEFCFDGFQIARTVKANVIDDLQNDITKNSKPYVKLAATFLGQKVNTMLDQRSVIPGQRPVRKKKIFLPNKLGKYPVPSYLKDTILHNSGDIELAVPELAQPLHISNYKNKLSTLLHAEEIKMEEEMHIFDLKCVLLRKFGEYLSLTVPGLAEGRPSLLLGDRVIVSFHGKGTDSPCYEGFIHEVHAESIMLKFNEGFQNSYGNDDLDVEFRFNRTSIRREHQAVDVALQLGEEVLFPTSVIPREPLFTKQTGGSIDPYNKMLNERQLVAVSRILAGCCRPLPYVLFGPPGTGKTITVVESILQIFSHIRHSRILVTAPSNSAADLIAERLHYSGVLSKCDMIRINAFQRSKLAMPEVIEPYCSKDTDDLKLASRHRIIVMTCNMSGYLYSLNLKVGHFTHIFVDEAGQATEPECLIPLGFAAGCEEAQIILSGDPFQLGPVLQSDIAQDYGLGISYLERLTSSKLYERKEDVFSQYGNYNPLLVTKLVNNYRSHSHLLKLSSSMFYNSELIPCADETVVNLVTGHSLLPNVDLPFIFHGLRSEDQREGNSPSWFNSMEAVQVLKYVQLVMKSFPTRISVDEIGIITPYRKQVEKIRVLLERFELSDIKVGSVEEFQGQERLCIIISTVRSNETFIGFDCNHNIGFLSNPKRFNVSITRAQALLIIVGNPVVLCHDPYWCAMLQYGVMNGCYTGCDLPSLHDEVIQENFKKALHLLGVGKDK